MFLGSWETRLQNRKKSKRKSPHVSKPFQTRQPLLSGRRPKKSNVKIQSKQTPLDDSITKGLSQTSAGGGSARRVCLKTLKHLCFPYTAFQCQAPTRSSKCFERNSYHIWWLDVYAKINIQRMASPSLGYKSTYQSADWGDLKGSFAQQPQTPRPPEIK